MGFKKSYKSACKKCRKSRKGKRGRGLGKMLKKAVRFVKKAINSDLGKLAISQGLAHVPELYDIGTSKIKNKKIKKLSQSDIAKGLLNKVIDKAYFRITMEVEVFGVINLELESFFKTNGENLSNNFVGVFPADEKRE